MIFSPIIPSSLGISTAPKLNSVRKRNSGFQMAALSGAAAGA